MVSREGSMMQSNNVIVRLARVDDAPQVQATGLTMNSVAEVRRDRGESGGGRGRDAGALVAEVDGQVVGKEHAKPTAASGPHPSCLAPC
jgi:hypothetical protein